MIRMLLISLLLMGCASASRSGGRAPRITNKDLVERALGVEAQRLIDIGWWRGRDDDKLTVEMWMKVLEDGSGAEIMVNRSSGHMEVDAAAMRIGRQVRFAPAVDGDGNYFEVWAVFPVVFVRRRELSGAAHGA